MFDIKAVEELGLGEFRLQSIGIDTDLLRIKLDSINNFHEHITSSLELPSLKSLGVLE